MKTPKGPPANLNSLNKRIDNIAGGPGDNSVRLRRAIANAIVAQMLPAGGVAKGGAAMKFRVGEGRSRFSRDFDAARRAGMSVEDFIDAFEELLAVGWNGVTSRIVPRTPSEPLNVPDEYIMRPFDLRLSYLGQAWMTVPFELGHDEIGSADEPTYVMDDELADTIVALGFPRPEPVPVLAVEFQVAQKLHACTTPERNGGNERAHDLVDLQILLDDEPLDPERLDDIGRRLFAARQVAPWPPVVQAWPGWDTAYVDAAQGLDVRPLDEAVAWANAVIAEAVATRHTG